MASGLSVVQTCALSVLLFTGGSQFALVGRARRRRVRRVGDGVGGAARRAEHGLRRAAGRAAAAARAAPARRRPAGHRRVDGRRARRRGRSATRAGRLGFWATGLAVFVLWNLATLVGAVAGSVIGDPRALGLDAAAPAAFLALLAPRLRDRPTWLTAVVAALVAVAVVPFVPAGVPGPGRGPGAGGRRARPAGGRR